VVETVSLDEWTVSKSLRPTFLKIDIEGAETLLFQGAARFLAEHKPALLCEASQSSLAELTAFFASVGYEVFQYDGRILHRVVDSRAVSDSPNCISLHKDRIASYPLADVFAVCR